MTCFFTFFTTLDIIWPTNFSPRPHPIWFFLLVCNSINTKKFNWNPAVLKKIAKTSSYFWPNLCAKMGSPWAMPKTKNNFFFKIIKPDQLSKTFYFNKISYVLAELWMFFYYCNAFLLKEYVPTISSHNITAVATFLLLLQI